MSIRTFSFPDEDLDDLAALADEHGGWSAMFQALYKPVLAYVAAHREMPEGDKLAELVEAHKADREAQKEALARMRKERHQGRAAKAKAKDEARIAKKRAAYPTAEKLGEAFPSATTEKLRALAQEYGHDVEAVIVASQRKRAREEADLEARIRPKPQTFDEWVERGVTTFRLYRYEDALRAVDQIARENNLNRGDFTRAVTNRWRGQQNLPNVAVKERDAS